MIYYAKQIDETGAILALHTMDRPFVPVTESKYTALLADWEAAQPEPEEAPGAWERVA